MNHLPLLRDRYRKPRLILLTALVVLCVGNSSLAQDQSFTKSENHGGNITTTTETKHENGDVTIERTTFDGSKNKIHHSVTKTKATGESVIESEAYDCQGRIKAKHREEKNASGKTVKALEEFYEDGVLIIGRISEYPQDGGTEISVYDSEKQQYVKKNLAAPPFEWNKVQIFNCLPPASEYKINPTEKSGLFNLDFSTPYGRIELNLPSDMRLGDTIGGTILTSPKGANQSEKEKNLEEMNKYVIELAGTRFKVSDHRFSCDLPKSPGEGNHSINLERDNKVVSQLRMLSPALTQEQSHQFILPTGGQQGRLLDIHGPFDGKLDNTSVKIGETTIPILAESPRRTIVRNTSESTGPTKIECNEHGKVTNCPFRNLEVGLSAGKLNLQKGETTTLKVVVGGLAGITREVPLEIENNSPGVIEMSDGVKQKVLIRPADVHSNGLYFTERKLTGKTAGSFGITATVIWDQLCKDGKAF